MWRQPIARLSERVKSVAGPSPLVRRIDQVRAQSGEFDVYEVVIPVALSLQKNAAVAFVPQRAAAPIFPVVMARVPTANLHHHFGECAAGGRRDNQMIVRRHERERIDLNAMLSRGLDDRAQ